MTFECWMCGRIAKTEMGESNFVTKMLCEDCQIQKAIDVDIDVAEHPEPISNESPK